MRISDWSSDVCSSDLAERRQPFGTLDSIKTTRLLYLRYGNGEIAVPLESGGNEGLQLRISEELPPADFHRPPTEHPVARVGGGVIRSEEHTSELQSLMRISYAVFCLKNKKCQQVPHLVPK